ncbi:APC family permease [Paenibacillus hodogayensis]|uniref:APC family permease n=1 Tax=Paenibacillus hodogayensis TaxID=279208 RepID=A0ABV5W3S4_9BACL
MRSDKMGPVALSGLIIGPVLGSGIFILPPIVYGIAGDWAILAWIAIIVISCLVAFLFGFLSMQFPGDGGTTNAIEHVFGVYVKRLAAFYLIIGVTFGASAVLLTAGQYMEKLSGISALTVSYIVLPVCIALLLARIDLLGKLAFAMSILCAVVLFAGGVKSLLDYPKPMVITGSFDLGDFSYALLLLFWAIFGWEVIGNYSADVIEPKKTIAKAILISMAAISLVYLVVAAAIQWTDLSEVWKGELTVTAVVYTLFGHWSHLVIALLALFLCCSTYFLYVGGISRLVASLAKEKVLPQLLGKRTKTNVPFAAVIVIFILNFFVLLLVQADVFHLEKLVAFANSFLTIHTLIGIGAGIVLVRNMFIRISGLLLAIVFIAMLLLHSSIATLLLMGILAFYYGCRQWAANRSRR